MDFLKRRFSWGVGFCEFQNVYKHEPIPAIQAYILLIYEFMFQMMLSKCLKYRNYYSHCSVKASDFFRLGKSLKVSVTYHTMLISGHEHSTRSIVLMREFGSRASV